MINVQSQNCRLSHVSEKFHFTLRTGPGVTCRVNAGGWRVAPHPWSRRLPNSDDTDSPKYHSLHLASPVLSSLIKDVFFHLLPGRSGLSVPYF